MIKLKPRPPLKKICFSEVTITSVLERLQLPNFGHMDRSTKYFESHNNFLMSWTGIMTSYTLFQKTLTLRRPGVDNFADIKIAIILIKATLKMQWKSQEFLENFIKQFLHVFPDITKIINFYWKAAHVTRT